MAEKRKRTPTPNLKLLQYLEFQQQRKEAVRVVRRRLTEILRLETADHIAIGCIQRLVRWRMLEATSGGCGADAVNKLNDIIQSDSSNDWQKKRARKTLDEINRLTNK